MYLVTTARLVNISFRQSWKECSETIAIVTANRLICVRVFKVKAQF